MNPLHAQLCSSAEWAEHLQETVLPWVLGDRNLGEELVEIGPGYGLATDVLRTRARQVTAVEIDEELSATLELRFSGTNVRVVTADAAALPFPGAAFSAAASFTMLHHVPTIERQDRILHELARVLRPGGLLVGSDSLDSPEFRKFHEGDVCLPIDPLTIGARLEQAGFVDVDLTVWSIGTRFVAHKPGPGR